MPGTSRESLHTTSTNIAIEATVIRFDGPYGQASREGNVAASTRSLEDAPEFACFFAGTAQGDRVFSRGACDNTRRLPEQRGTIRWSLLRLMGSNRVSSGQVWICCVKRFSGRTETSGNPGVSRPLPQRHHTFENGGP